MADTPGFKLNTTASPGALLSAVAHVHIAEVFFGSFCQLRTVDELIEQRHLIA